MTCKFRKKKSLLIPNIKLSLFPIQEEKPDGFLWCKKNLSWVEVRKHKSYMEIDVLTGSFSDLINLCHLSCFKLCWNLLWNHKSVWRSWILQTYASQQRFCLWGWQTEPWSVKPAAWGNSHDSSFLTRLNIVQMLFYNNMLELSQREQTVRKVLPPGNQLTFGSVASVNITHRITLVQYRRQHELANLNVYFWTSIEIIK